MKTTAILSILMLSSVILCSQTLNMTFKAAGAATKVDSVKATNLRTTETITLPGSDTLVLNVNTGIVNLNDINRNGCIFPNPFAGKTTFLAYVGTAQNVTVEVYNLSGQSVARTKAQVQPGSVAFSLLLSKVGVYMIRLTTDEGTTGFKAVCTESIGGGNQILYTGTDALPQKQALKGTVIFNLGYKLGDVLLYRCRSGDYTTIITDSPTASTAYLCEFVLCRDPDGKNYAVVNIGTQTWMAENLAWLPAVSAASKGSDSLKYYYVYGYDDSIVSSAKNTVNYKRYGALYNWAAAMNAPGKRSAALRRTQDVCPAGWHLPYDEDWKLLETTLGMSRHDADSIYLRNSGEVGKKLKSTPGWITGANCSNSSGFTALPGGYRNTHWNFQSLERNSLFWSASQSDTLAWYRNLDEQDTGVYRFSTLKSHGFSVRCIKDPF